MFGTFILQAALPVRLVLGLSVALQALVLQQSLFSLQLPQTRLQVLPAAHLNAHLQNHGFITRFNRDAVYFYFFHQLTSSSCSLVIFSKRIVAALQRVKF